ncbi:MAG: prolyl oligopeptidase family serine peptidase [Chloroflexi bacterium]|nr:prolyl oligopeptidase family serine peptidase [Chloroflexota bacterium]
MPTFELTFESANYATSNKLITALVITPPEMTPETGAMLFTHGWGCNRYQYRELMEATCARDNLVGISVEFRQSGYDFSPSGYGWMIPYDLSFMQVVDVLNGMRSILEILPALNRRRLYHYGGSQGGHIALLSAIYAPRTWAWVYAASPMTHLSPNHVPSSGRCLAPHEAAVRDVAGLAGYIGCRVILEHGTADTTVDCDTHTRALQTRLEELGKPVEAHYYEGGGHDLEPVTTRLDSFELHAAPWLHALRPEEGPDDFAAGSRIELDCAGRRLTIDWSKPVSDATILTWDDTAKEPNHA